MEGEGMTAGEMIERARKTRALMTQEGLAAELGCTAAAISGWENDRFSPSIRYRKRLFQVLEFTPAEESRMADLIEVARQL